jgi:hypothetical protein
VPVLRASAVQQVPAALPITTPTPVDPAPAFPRVPEPAHINTIAFVVIPVATPVVPNDIVQQVAVQRIHPATPIVVAGATIATRVAFYHAALFSPSIST